MGRGGEPCHGKVCSEKDNGTNTGTDPYPGLTQSELTVGKRQKGRGTGGTHESGGEKERVHASFLYIIVARIKRVGGKKKK